MLLTPAVRMSRITETVCCVYGISVEEVMQKEWNSKRWGNSKKMPTRIAIPKQVISYMATLHTYLNMQQIANRMGYANKSTVSTNVKLTQRVMSVDVEFRTTITTIEQNLFQ